MLSETMGIWELTKELRLSKWVWFNVIRNTTGHFREAFYRLHSTNKQRKRMNKKLSVAYKGSIWWKIGQEKKHEKKYATQ